MQGSQPMYRFTFETRLFRRHERGLRVPHLRSRFIAAAQPVDGIYNIRENQGARVARGGRSVESIA